MKVLITGISGFSGTNLLQLLLSLNDSNIEILGISRSKFNLKEEQKVKTCQINLMDYSNLLSIIKEYAPDIIFHLAGKNKGEFQSLMETNVICTKYLLDAIIEARLNPNILIAGSSSQYGFAGVDSISEKSPFAPQSEYGMSKCLQENLAQYFFKKNGLNIVFTRTFNLIGPNQAQNMFVGSIINQIIEIKNGLKKDIQVFHLNSSRDYIDVRDAVRAYWMLASSKNFPENINGEEFNVGSGISSSLTEILSLIFECACIHPQIKILNPNQIDIIPTQKASIKKISETINWKPEYSLRNSIMNLIEAYLLFESE